MAQVPLIFGAKSQPTMPTDAYTDDVLDSGPAWFVNVAAADSDATFNGAVTTINSTLMNNGVRFYIQWGTGLNPNANQKGSTSVYMTNG